MSGGISRVHGGVKPGNLAGVSLNDFTLGWASGVNTATLVTDWNSGNGSIPGGAFDAAFRTAIETVGTVYRIGALNNAAGVNFSLETLGSDGSDSALGTGLPSSLASTALALQGAVRALGTYTYVYTVSPGTTASATVNFNSATVTAFAGPF